MSNTSPDAPKSAIPSQPALRYAPPADYVPRVSWAAISGKGRGVIALRDCGAGCELERAPVIVVPTRDTLKRGHNLTVFDQYLLFWSDTEGAELAMGGGLLMFYNHSASPNVEFHSGPEPLTMSVIALRDISAGEELLCDYDVDLWFQPA